MTASGAIAIGFAWTHMLQPPAWDEQEDTGDDGEGEEEPKEDALQRQGGRLGELGFKLAWFVAAVVVTLLILSYAKPPRSREMPPFGCWYVVLKLAKLRRELMFVALPLAVGYCVEELADELMEEYFEGATTQRDEYTIRILLSLFVTVCLLWHEHGRERNARARVAAGLPEEEEEEEDDEAKEEPAWARRASDSG